MAVTNVDKKRAYRLRRRLDAGAALDAEDAAWMADYSERACTRAEAAAIAHSARAPRSVREHTKRERNARNEAREAAIAVQREQRAKAREEAKARREQVRIEARHAREDWKRERASLANP